MPAEYTTHIKASHLKDLVQREDLHCDQILNNIKQILGLPPSTVNTNVDQQNEGNGGEVAEEGEQQLQVADSRTKSYTYILEGLTGNRLKLARGFLDRIEQSQDLAWDYDTYELIIFGKKVLHSDIRILVLKCITVESASLPVGFTKLIFAALKAKIPINYFQNSDALNVRKALLYLRKEGVFEENNTEYKDNLNNDNSSANVADNLAENFAENSAENSAENIAENSGAINIQQRKRGREETEGEEGNSEEGESKKIKLSPEESAPFRRSARIKLKDSIGKHWKKL